MQKCCPNTALSDPDVKTIQRCIEAEEQGMDKFVIVLIIFGAALGLSCFCCLAKTLCNKINAWRASKVADNKFREPLEIRETDWKN